MNKDIKQPWWQPAVSVFAEVTGWIAAPILIALFLGNYLDKRFESEPWILLGLSAVAVTMSCIRISIVASRYIKKIEKESKSNESINHVNERDNGTHGSSR